MKTRPCVLFFAFLVMAVSALPGADKSAAIPGGKLYVTIEYFDPIAFREFRYGVDSGQDLILTQLKAKAAEMAQAAHLSGDVVVLNEDEKAPAGAPVLRLTWGNDAVMAVYIPSGGKPNYLGVVSRDPLTLHPDYQNARRRIETRANSGARRDELIRVRTEFELYVAFQYLVEKLAA